MRRARPFTVRATWLWVAAVNLLVAFDARATECTPNEVAAAEELFSTGRKLADERRYAEACAKLEASQSACPGSGTLLNLADCYEKLGRSATAKATFVAAAAAARDKGNAAREKVARERAARLEPRLAKLKITVPEQARIDGLSIRSDGVDLVEGAWNTPLPVDPGKRQIEATAPGHDSWTLTVEVPDEPKVVELIVPTLVWTTTLDGTPDPGEDQRGVAWVVGGFGTVTTLVGFGFGIAALRLKNDTQGECNTTHVCTQQGFEPRKDALTYAHVSTALVVTGLAIVGSGVAVYVTAADAPETDATDDPGPSAGLRFGAGSLTLEAAW